MYQESRQIRGIPLWLLREYLEELGGTAVKLVPLGLQAADTGKHKIIAEKDEFHDPHYIGMMRAGIQPCSGGRF